MGGLNRSSAQQPQDDDQGALSRHLHATALTSRTCLLPLYIYILPRAHASLCVRRLLCDGLWRRYPLPAADDDEEGAEGEGDDAAQDGEKRKAKANRRRAQQAQTTEARWGGAPMHC